MPIRIWADEVDNIYVWETLIDRIYVWVEQIYNRGIQRYFTYLDWVDDFYTPSTPLIISSDYEFNLKWYFELMGLTWIRTLLGGNNTSIPRTFGFYLNASWPNVTIQYPLTDWNLQFFNISIAPFDTTLNEFIIKKAWDTVTITLNGVSTSRTNPLFSDIEVNYIWRFGSGVYYDWVISDIKLWTWGDSSTWTLIHQWDLDWDWTNSVEVDLVWGNDLTKANILPTQTVLYTLNESTVPNQWEASGHPTLPLPN